MLWVVLAFCTGHNPASAKLLVSRLPWGFGFFFFLSEVGVVFGSGAQSLSHAI